ncbi:MAG: hypothetical protein EOL88_00710 [Bacteroidia bacterium]|nr:hypothetical protein [Bacteroidia bacterium]
MENKKRKYMTRKRRGKILKRKIIFTLIVVGVLSGYIWSEGNKTIKSIETLANTNEINSEEIIIREVVSETIREVTAYNVGDVNQTDSSPCIGAYSKVNLCEEVAKGQNVCAANFVPLGTELQIIASNGWSFECIVWDRMNSRFGNRVDIAMNYWEKDRAIKFGKQNLTVRILGEKSIVRK